MRACIVVPHYDHLEQFRRFLPDLAGVGLPIIVVDDASPPSVVVELDKLLVNMRPNVRLVKHTRNRGKGGAVSTGLREAAAAGFTHALQVDADGQHDCADIPEFMDAIRKYPASIVCGRPVFDESISRLRFYARYITLFFVRIETISKEIEDAMCGYRMYPVQATLAIVQGARLGKRMAFDPELLVRAVWSGIPLHFLRVNVVYPEEGRSHFHYFRDNLEITWMHVRLLFGMLLRLPALIVRGKAWP
jgi:glycosyltransferase involved in cell wall biosynthesis